MVITAWQIETLFAGGIRELEDDGSPTGIYKTPVRGTAYLDYEGLAGDAQADLKHHGGPERALNHYPADHYSHWRERFPARSAAFVPGVLGENLSTHGVTEAEVRVGDVFQLGTATIQISQPRQPCWKIARRLGLPKLARDVADSGRAGWLYRVLEPGKVAAGDDLRLIEVADHGITLARLWTLQATRRPGPEDREIMVTLARLPTLAQEWRRRFASRLEWLCRAD